MLCGAFIPKSYIELTKSCVTIGADSGEFRYVDSLSLYGKYTNIYASDRLSLSTINCGSYINLTESEDEYGYITGCLGIEACCISICGNDNLRLYGGCISMGPSEYSNKFLVSNWDSVTLGNIENGSTDIQGRYVKISLPGNIGCTNNVVVLEGYNYDDNEPSLSINTDLYDEWTRKGTYEVTKGISDIGINKADNTPYIPDLVNRIFKYSGTVTSFSAKPKYTYDMKDNVLYEFEVWHTIPNASGVTYTSPKNVEWLYEDPAESGIELTDGITLYYAFRAFKSGTDVIVQGNLYATTTPQATQE
jgi:hypothetical protein